MYELCLIMQYISFERIYVLDDSEKIPNYIIVGIKYPASFVVQNININYYNIDNILICFFFLQHIDICIYNDPNLTYTKCKSILYKQYKIKYKNEYDRYSF